MNHGLVPYIGGKHRIANRIVQHLKATGADTIVDLFGGSAAVLIAAAMDGFKKRIYNDIDGDLVNLFTVVGDPARRRQLLNMLRWTPPSREIYEYDTRVYVKGGLSFKSVEDPVLRARCTLYRHMFAFGGKVRSGGFSVSVMDRPHIKEVGRYRNTLCRLASIGRIFMATVIECKHYLDVIAFYGSKPSVVIYADPPYVGTEHYYSRAFGTADHVFLAHALSHCAAKVVVSYYETPEIRELYPEPHWKWNTIVATANSGLRRGNKKIVEERIIVRVA